MKPTSRPNMRLTILGCGSSGGNPRVGNDWGKSDPTNPKNRRRRASALVERIGPNGTTVVLIDTGPDMREQLLAVRATHLDAVLYTHEHADHAHGIDDLRGFAYAMKRRVPVWFDGPTRASLMSKFGYCFETPPGGSYPAILTPNDIVYCQPIIIDGPGGPITALPIPQEHGDIISLGFRFGAVAYSPDISGLPEASIPHLEGLDTWVVDALRYIPHPSHWSVKQTLSWVERLQPKRTIFTHMLGDLDYDTLRRELPAGVEPAHDGLVVEF
jgi:phosphoribosyl 1,2-cyclic phosphate phosphodiesterase